MVPNSLYAHSFILLLTYACFIILAAIVLASKTLQFAKVKPYTIPLFLIILIDVFL